jgi:DNA-binding transcriptional regulator YiaG
MKAEEVREIREKLDMTREEFAELLCLSSYNSVMNIETGFRNAGKLTAKLLRYIDSLSKAKAKAFIEEINRHEP